MELDDRLTVASAEGIDLDLVLAGIGSRGSAFAIDLCLQALMLLAIAVVGAAFGGFGLAFASIATFLVLLGYPILMEAFAGGQTLGKRALGVAVVSTEGTTITFLAAVIRNLVRLVDALPGVYFVGIVSILATDKNQRIGDMAAGTLVIHTTRRQATVVGSPSFTGYAPGPVPLPPDAAGWDISTVTVEETAALRSFLQRRGDLDPAQRANLAQTLAFQILPKVAGVPLDGGPEAFIERVVAAKALR